MRMRFWATTRSPAFSISALTAPVRLRSVASGLMIEKVRSIAIAYVLAKRWLESWGLISAPPHDGKRPCDAPAPPFLACFRAVHAPREDEDYSNFTEVNPV